jgi:ubiquinone biosynthesis protein
VISLEGLGRQFDPAFQLVDRIRPFLDRALSERYQPIVAMRRSQATLANIFGLVTNVPRDLARLVKDARRGRMRVDLDLKRLDRFADRLDNTINRMTIGIMTASLVIGSSIVMTVGGGPSLFGLPLLTLLGLVGYLIAFVNSLWIILSIWRSRQR